VISNEELAERNYSGRLSEDIMLRRWRLIGHSRFTVYEGTPSGAQDPGRGGGELWREINTVMRLRRQARIVAQDRARLSE